MKTLECLEQQNISIINFFLTNLSVKKIIPPVDGVEKKERKWKHEPTAFINPSSLADRLFSKLKKNTEINDDGIILTVLS